MAPHLPHAFQELPGKVSSKAWADWRCDFELFVDRKVSKRERVVALRYLTLANPTPAQQAALDALAISEKDKLLDLLGCLGSEGLRRFRMKSSWNINQQKGNKKERTSSTKIQMGTSFGGWNSLERATSTSRNGTQARSRPDEPKLGQLK
ncbi:MAG: hypothetical protein GY696_36175, partial [Gammaproteobacteria bacterium]|nr:hypothetical protein [Gammaproteobacteria bacterium]